MRAFHITCMVTFLLASGLATSALCQVASYTFADTEYNDTNWIVEVISEFGGSASHEQRLTGGNPGAYRYMQHVLPEPPGPQDLTRIEVVHIDTSVGTFPFIDSILFLDYSEDIRLLNLPWPDGFVTSAPALEQNGVYYRCTQFISVVGDTNWVSDGLTGLTETDFVALDGSGAHPDFTPDNLINDEIHFGFWRVHTRGFTQPPIPPGQDLIYEHASDNWTVTVYSEEPQNAPPVARDDDFLYLGYLLNSQESYFVTSNDSDADGDSIWIISVEEGPGVAQGQIINFTGQSITYQYTDPEPPTTFGDFFFYTITDSIDTDEALLTIHFCTCPIECMFAFVPGAGGVAHLDATYVRSGLDSLDIELFRRLRDDFLSPDTTGLQMIDFYYHAAPELMPLLLFERQDLGLQAYRALELMQPPLQSLLDGDGSEPISQQLVDSVSLFMDSLLVAVSDTLRDSLELRLAQLCPLQDLVGLTVAEAAASVFCDSMSTSILDPRRHDGFFGSVRPNPFAGSTTVTLEVKTPSDVRISVTDLSGSTVRHLFNDLIYPGDTVTLDWNGEDDNGADLPEGMYFIRLETGTAVQVMKAILVR